MQSLIRFGMACLLIAGAVPAGAQDAYEQPPVAYSASQPENAVTELQRRLEDGSAKLEFDEQFGYLPDVLKALNIPQESQVLVFSKTSLQRHRISPRTPRAIYFNDDIYLGYCDAGEKLEISIADPQLGAVFYTLDQKRSDVPKLVRNVDNCLVCHSSSRTENVPGHLVRSLYVDAGGQPIFSAGSRSVDHTTPLAERWGGWYVTGTHGEQTHLGNLIVRDRRAPRDVDNSAGQNVESLAERLRIEKYLTKQSDIVAHMVLEHQVMVHNRITSANFATREALAHEAMMNKALDYPAEHRLESTTRRIASAGDDLIEALLFTDETQLTAPVTGTSGFSELFQGIGPRDSQGRSLRDLDLKTRMFRYPCSYLVYSESFTELPPEMLDYVWTRLWEILTTDDVPEEFAHLTPADREAIQEILCETVPNLPECWSKQANASE